MYENTNVIIVHFSLFFFSSCVRVSHCVSHHVSFGVFSLSHSTGVLGCCSCCHIYSLIFILLVCQTMSVFDISFPFIIIIFSCNIHIYGYLSIHAHIHTGALVFTHMSIRICTSMTLWRNHTHVLLLIPLISTTRIQYTHPHSSTHIQGM